jgi:hypothetical protein
MDEEIKTAVAMLSMEDANLGLSDFKHSWKGLFGWVI